MPYEHNEVIKAQYERLAADRARAIGEYEASRLSDDSDNTMAWADNIVSIDAKLAALGNIARQANAGARMPQARMPGRRVEIADEHGDKHVVQLTDEEVDIARRSLVDRPGMQTSDDDRLKSYAQQKKKLADWRANGKYDQRGS